MKIAVTQEHIDHAYNGWDVMRLVRDGLIATALKGAGFEDVIEGYETAWAGRYFIYLPDSVRRAVQEFHAGQVIAPFTFEAEFCEGR